MRERVFTAASASPMRSTTRLWRRRRRVHVDHGDRVFEEVRHVYLLARRRRGDRVRAATDEHDVLDGRLPARIDDVELAVLETRDVGALTVAGVHHRERRRLPADVGRADALVLREAGRSERGVEDLQRRRPAIDQVERDRRPRERHAARVDEPPLLPPTESRKKQLPGTRYGAASLTGRPTVNVWIRSSLRLPT